MPSEHVYPDALTVASDSYSVLFENDRVRVFDVHIKPGHKTPMHSHPENLVYAMTDAAVRFTDPDNNLARVTFKANTLTPLPARAHTVENLGTEEIHAIMVELK